MKAASRLNYEIEARRDPRLWWGLVTGCAMLGALLLAPTLNERPLLDGHGLWFFPSLALCAALLIVTALRRMCDGSSRGTRFDAETQTFHWWNGRDPRARGCIPAKRMARIIINESADTLEIRIYDTDGVEVEGFREWCLPQRYSDWLTAVQTLFPHLEVLLLKR